MLRYEAASSLTGDSPLYALNTECAFRPPILALPDHYFKGFNFGSLDQFLTRNQESVANLQATQSHKDLQRLHIEAENYYKQRSDGTLPASRPQKSQLTAMFMGPPP